MKNLEKFKTELEAIKNDIFSIKSKNPNIEPISDGIINIKEYLNSKYKILWILKESNDLDENGEGGGWCLNEELNKISSWTEKKGAGTRTIQRMVYSSYGILNNLVTWENMPSIYEPTVLKSLKQIAYINLKKLPGGNKSNDNEIRNAYIENKNIILNQIQTYNPDIIITGNTLQYIFEDLNINPENQKMVDDKTNNTSYYFDKKRLYIDTYHPAYFKVKEEIYCNEILSAVDIWEKSKN